MWGHNETRGGLDGEQRSGDVKPRPRFTAVIGDVMTMWQPEARRTGGTSVTMGTTSLSLGPAQLGPSAADAQQRLFSLCPSLPPVSPGLCKDGTIPCPTGTRELHHCRAVSHRDLPSRPSRRGIAGGTQEPLQMKGDLQTEDAIIAQTPYLHWKLFR